MVLGDIFFQVLKDTQLWGLPSGPRRPIGDIYQRHNLSSYKYIVICLKSRGINFIY